MMLLMAFDGVAQVNNSSINEVYNSAVKASKVSNTKKYERSNKTKVVVNIINNGSSSELRNSNCNNGAVLINTCENYTPVRVNSSYQINNNCRRYNNSNNYNNSNGYSSGSNNKSTNEYGYPKQQY